MFKPVGGVIISSEDAINKLSVYLPDKSIEFSKKNETNILNRLIIV